MKYTALFLFLLNFITSLLFLNEGLFHYDAVVLAQAVERTYQTKILQPSIQGRYGTVMLNLIFYFPFFILGQNADFSVRLTGILFHSLSIAMLFIFIKELFHDYGQALFSALFLSFTPIYFSPNTYGKEHGMGLFFLLLSFYLLLTGIRRTSCALLGTSSLIYVFSIAVRESNLVFLPFFTLFYLYLFLKNPLRPVLKIMVSFILPLVTALGLIYFLYLEGIVHKTLYIRDTATNYFLGPISPVLAKAMHDLTRGIPLALFLVSILGALKMLFDKKIFYSLFFLFWFMLLFYFGNASGYCARHLDVITIPIYIFSAYLLSRLHSQYKLATLTIVIYFVFSMFMYMYPLLEFRHRYNGEKQFALYVQEKTEDNALIIAMDDSPFMEYYAKRKTVTPPIDSQKIDTFIMSIASYLKANRPVYLIESGLGYDKSNRLKNSLFSQFNVTIIGEKLTEDYHRPELEFQAYYEKLFKVNL